MRYVVEPLAKEGAKGLTSAKIQLVRLLQGIAGDAAAGTDGMVVRTFGGVHIGVSAGLGFLGKVSIGDNATLSKLIEAVFGSIAASSSELYAADQLYDVTYPPGGAPNATEAVTAVLQFISKLNGASSGSSSPATGS